MPIKQLRIVKKIKFLISNRLLTKSQIVSKVEQDARQHRVINERQEDEDEVRVDHAQKELNEEEDKAAGPTNSYLLRILTISVVINFIFILVLFFIWQFVS